MLAAKIQSLSPMDRIRWHGLAPASFPSLSSHQLSPPSAPHPHSTGLPRRLGMHHSLFYHFETPLTGSGILCLEFFSPGPSSTLTNLLLVLQVSVYWFIFIFWSIVPLQCYGSFCYIAKWISPSLSWNIILAAFLPAHILYSVRSSVYSLGTLWTSPR